MLHISKNDAWRIRKTNSGETLYVNNMEIEVSCHEMAATLIRHMDSGQFYRVGLSEGQVRVHPA